MVKAIFYDLDGTLRYNDPPGREAFCDQAARLGLAVGTGQRRAALLWEHAYWAESADLLADLQEFPDPDTFWINYGQRQLAAMGAGPALAGQLALEIHRYMAEQYKPSDHVFPELVETLAELRQRGYFLGVVSNRDKPFGEYLAALGLADFFPIAISGGEAGAKKPDPGIFEYALQKTGHSARDVVYVGDNYFADVVGARNAGLRPVLFDVSGIFEDPGCPVIQAHGQILDVLEGM